MSRLIDADAIRLPKGFFEEVDNVPKFYEWLRKQPTIDLVKHGKNIGEGDFVCSECGFKDFYHGYEPMYCPNCGAKMEGEEG